MKTVLLLLMMTLTLSSFSAAPDTIDPNDSVTISNNHEKSERMLLEKEREMEKILRQQKALNKQVGMRKILVYGGIGTFILALLSLFYFLRKNSD